jgi:multidrug efflux pump subunit AcrA (membrane-fusion protein)
MKAFRLLDVRWTFLVLMPLMSSCSSGVVAGVAAPSGGLAIPTVTAEVRDIVSVVTANGTIVANPNFVVAANRAGEWHPRVAVGEAVRPNSIIGTVAGKAVRAGARGIVTSSFDSMRNAGAGVPLATISYDGFGVSAILPLDEAYRLYESPHNGNVIVANSVGATRCVIVTPPSVAVESSPESAPTLATLCLLPTDTRAILAGLPATVGFVTGTVSGVVALPIESVAGSAETGTVTVVTETGQEVRSVTLGITDGSWIEITGGLSAGEIVEGLAPSITEAR